MKRNSGKSGKSGKAGAHSNHRKDRDSRDSRETEDSGRSGGGGFVFRDRSGKVHTLGGRRSADGASGGRPSSTPHPVRVRAAEPPTPTSHSMDYLPGRERVYRPERAGKPERAPRPSPWKRSHEVVKLKASVDKNRKGFGFLAFEDRSYEDVFVPPREAEKLFHGDRVEVVISSRGEIQEINVLEHRFKELTGRWIPHPAGPSRGGWIVYERKKNREQVLIPNVGNHVLEEGDWLRSKLIFDGEGGTGVMAEIIEVYGADLPPRADISMIANEYSLIEEHPQASEDEAKAQKLEIPGKDLVGREDLRNVPFITIDGETARDFDDAVYVERSNGGYVLWVAIADVSHYVREGMALDDDARSRGTSVYFPERAFHMLPRALSENLCSLRPNEPRLTMVARMEYDRNGKRTRTELMEAVIQSKRRATYNQIQAEWEANQNNSNWEFTPHFELYRLIRKSRSDRGSIDFDFPEAELLVEPTGEVISIKNRARVDAHRLIEEFMIGANEAVTEWIMERAWPFVYRVHDVPAMQALEKFQTLAGNVGVDFSIGDASPKVMADLVRELEEHPAKDLLNMALLRSMKQAVYSSVHGVHFGLASPGYTHFTSPIRRYPDLVVHRVLRWALRVEKGIERGLDERTRRKLEDDLTAICEHCSYRERLASDAERDANKLKQVRLLLKHLGEEFEGKINGMTENGMFVALNDPFAEGMLPKDSLMDDSYRFDDEHMIFYGTRKRRTFRIGDPVKVRVARADIDTRMVDFELLEGGTFGREHPAGASKPKRGDRQDQDKKRGRGRGPKGKEKQWGSKSAGPWRVEGAATGDFENRRERKGKHPEKHGFGKSPAGGDGKGKWGGGKKSKKRR